MGSGKNSWRNDRYSVFFHQYGNNSNFFLFTLYSLPSTFVFVWWTLLSRVRNMGRAKHGTGIIGTKWGVQKSFFWLCYLNFCQQDVCSAVRGIYFTRWANHSMFFRSEIWPFSFFCSKKYVASPTVESVQTLKGFEGSKQRF